MEGTEARKKTYRYEWRVLEQSEESFQRVVLLTLLSAVMSYLSLQGADEVPSSAW